MLKDDYKQELNDYNGRIAAHEEHLRTVGSINNVNPMYDRAPAVLSVMFKRGAADRLIEYDIGVHFRTDTSDPIPELLPMFDVGAILGVIMSLMAILFAYDAIVSEREAGTLKLALSNSVTRSRLILGKWIGGYISLMLPLAVSLIVGLLIVTTDPMVNLRGGDWIALGLIYLGAMIYTSIFFAIAYFISAISRSFAASALISLCVWLFIVLIVPNASIYIAGKLRPMPSIQEYQRRLGQIESKRQREAEKVVSEFMRKEPTEAEQAKFFEEAFAESGFLVVGVRDQLVEETKLAASFERATNSQVDLARQIFAISPYMCFTYITNTLSSTGIQAERDLVQRAGKHSTEWINYIMEKHRENTRSIVDINKKTDVSDMPRFRYTEQSVSERLSASLVYFLLLIIFNVVFFMAAYAAFLKSGVR